MFFPDLVGLPDVRDDVLAGVAVVNDALDPVTVVAAVAAVTTRVRLIATASTSFSDPRVLAEDFASLQQISHGRAGWNIVTSLNEAEARNFRHAAHLAHADRYAHANRVVDELVDYWGSRRPLLAQAGSSPAGRALAARVADVVFARALDIHATRDFVVDIRARAAREGRDPRTVRILPELATVVGESRAQAEDEFARVRALLDPRVALADVGYWAGVDLSDADLDAPLPPPADGAGSKGAQVEIYRAAHRDGLTVRELADAVAAGDGAVIGTATDIADHIERYVSEAGVDGFTVSFPWLPGTLTAFTERVVPELRRRELLRTGTAEGAGHDRRPQRPRA